MAFNEKQVVPVFTLALLLVRCGPTGAFAYRAAQGYTEGYCAKKMQPQDSLTRASQMRIQLEKTTMFS
nr:unnamed protein product [Digitaria exilis]